MKRVLVAGGAGYVGSHTVKALAEAGCDVTVYDNLSAGHREAVERLAQAFPDRRIELVEGDILDTARVRQALEQSGAEAVMHFAALLSVAGSVRDPLGYYRNNVQGTLSVLEAMAAAGVPCFVFSSTCATFGEPVTPTIDETHPQRPINAYGESKLAVERALPHIERAHGIRWVALRYFNASGADPDGLIGEDHEPEEHIIPRAIRAAQGQGSLAIYGDDYPTDDGTCVRDYVHVSDLADAHLAALRRLESGGASGCFNLGSGRGMSVREVIDTVGRIVGRPVPHTVGPRRAGDPARLVASPGLAERELGWKPKLGTLEAIVETAWRWHERHPNGYGSRRNR
ncbi:MAG: UDP-glucose 4-epimerase GalE [Acidobacteriota bacterium]|jgi:UDP-glucose-4-epimerase GalE|nr:MAG: UDP-glucose 4-epimerase GalE [Acidobacteriota bacterium]